MKKNTTRSQDKALSNKDISPEVWKLFDDYVHSRIDRRQFLSGASKASMAGVSASAILAFLSPRYAEATQVKADDPRLQSEFIEYPSPKGAGASANGASTMRALLSRPKNMSKKSVAEKLPGIIVVHENRGLNPHIEDVTRRAALEGFIALGPDALTPLGGYPGTDDEGRALQQKRDRNEILEDFIAAFEYLKKHPECNGSIGVVGFCFGDWVSNMMAARVPELKAAVPFYGGQAPLDEVANIRAPLLLQFAENDERVNQGWPDYEAALKKNNKAFSAYTYPETQHGFHNDTTPRYDPEAAKLAWQRTIAFFKEHL